MIISKKISNIKLTVSVLTLYKLQKQIRFLPYRLFIKIFVCLLKLNLIFLILPSYICAFSCNVLLSVKEYSVAKRYAKKAMKFSSSTTYASSMYIDIIKYYEPDKNEWLKMYERAIKAPLWSMDHIIIRNWIFWNGSFSEKRDFLEQSLISANQALDSKLLGKFRFLEDYSSNLGHHGCLFLYLTFRKLSKQLNQTNIVLDLKKSHNRYFLNLILKKFEINPSNISSDEYDNSKLKMKDSLFLGLDITKKQFRFEADASHFVSGFFPEWNPPTDDYLKLSDDEVALGSEIFKDVLKNRWFVILHVKQNSSGPIVSSQARDCNILDYHIFCNNIRDLGGIVIRMGDKRFPQIDKKLEIFDYAYSSLKSEFADCWLWSQCQWWTGNINGALMPPLTFGKPRLITNQWHWALRGGRNDLISPKLLYKNDEIVPLPRIIKSSVSATQNRETIEKFGYTLKDNSPQLLGRLAIEMHEKVILKTHVNSPDARKLTNLLKNELLIPNSDLCMSFSNSFSADFYSDLSIN